MLGDTASEPSEGQIDEINDALQSFGYTNKWRLLGNGSYARVYLSGVTDETKKKHRRSRGVVAVKIINKKAVPCRFREFIAREVTTHKIVARHPHIVTLFRTFESSLFRYMVMEYCPYGNMLQYVQQCFARQACGLPENEAQHYFNQVVDAVAFCHSKGIVHRDIKLENLLVYKKGVLKLSDFGFATAVPYSGSLLQQWCGSLQYVAPEVLLRHWYDGELADCWSLGVVLFGLINGQLPMQNCRTGQEILGLAHSQDYCIHKSISPEAIVLILQILQMDPDLRLRIPGIKQHPWCKGQELPPGFDLAVEKMANSQKTKNGSKLKTYERCHWRSHKPAIHVGETHSEIITLKSRNHSTRLELARLYGLGLRLKPPSDPAMDKMLPSVTQSPSKQKSLLENRWQTKPKTLHETSRRPRMSVLGSSLTNSVSAYIPSFKSFPLYKILYPAPPPSSLKTLPLRSDWINIRQRQYEIAIQRRMHPSLFQKKIIPVKSLELDLEVSHEPKMVYVTPSLKTQKKRKPDSCQVKERNPWKVSETNTDESLCITARSILQHPEQKAATPIALHDDKAPQESSKLPMWSPIQRDKVTIKSAPWGAQRHLPHIRSMRVQCKSCSQRIMEPDSSEHSLATCISCKALDTPPRSPQPLAKRLPTCDSPALTSSVATSDENNPDHEIDHDEHDKPSSMELTSGNSESSQGDIAGSSELVADEEETGVSITQRSDGSGVRTNSASPQSDLLSIMRNGYVTRSDITSTEESGCRTTRIDIPGVEGNGDVTERSEISDDEGNDDATHKSDVSNAEVNSDLTHRSSFSSVEENGDVTQRNDISNAEGNGSVTQRSDNSSAEKHSAREKSDSPSVKTDRSSTSESSHSGIGDLDLVHLQSANSQSDIHFFLTEWASNSDAAITTNHMQTPGGNREGTVSCLPQLQSIPNKSEFSLSPELDMPPGKEGSCSLPEITRRSIDNSSFSKRPQTVASMMDKHCIICDQSAQAEVQEEGMTDCHGDEATNSDISSVTTGQNGDGQTSNIPQLLHPVGLLASGRTTAPASLFVDENRSDCRPSCQPSRCDCCSVGQVSAPYTNTPLPLENMIHPSMKCISPSGSLLALNDQLYSSPDIHESPTDVKEEQRPESPVKKFSVEDTSLLHRRLLPPLRKVGRKVYSMSSFDPSVNLKRQNRSQEIPAPSKPCSSSDKKLAPVQPYSTPCMVDIPDPAERSHVRKDSSCSLISTRPSLQQYLNCHSFQESDSLGTKYQMALVTIDPKIPEFKSPWHLPEITKLSSLKVQDVSHRRRQFCPPVSIKNVSISKLSVSSAENGIAGNGTRLRSIRNKFRCPNIFSSDVTEYSYSDHSNVTPGTLPSITRLTLAGATKRIY